MAKKKAEAEVTILRVDTTTLGVRIVGRTPLLCNSMSAKVKQELLLPSRKKNKAEKETTLKHNPLEEFRSSIYRAREEASDTLLVFPGGGMKAAIAQAAVDIPGAAKAQIGRLAHVEEINIPVFGIPQIHMGIVRQAGMNKTPDVRTRAIVPEWACEFNVRFTRPNLTEQQIADLTASAGLIVGIGDGRPEKGKLSFGQFELVDQDDETFTRIMATGGRDAQVAAMENPACYDHETAELLEWFNAEAKRRDFKVA